MPYLVCDKPEESERVTHYFVFGLGAGGFADPVRVEAYDGPLYGFQLDLSGLQPGTYTVKANACNETQCSIDSAPFVFTAYAAPRPPRGFRIISDG